MPQLDKVTFLSQFFWLCIFYFGFYLILVKHFLPRMSRLLKLRQTKMNLSQEGFSLVQQEKSELQIARDSLLAAGAQTARNSVGKTLQKTSDWVHQTIDQTNRGHFQSFNQAYISSLQNMMTSQNTIQMINLKAVLSPRSHTLAGLNPQCGALKEAFYTQKILALLSKNSKTLKKPLGKKKSK